MKSRGAKWDDQRRKWHTTAEHVSVDPDFWNQFNPTAAEDVALLIPRSCNSVGRVAAF